MSVRLRRLKSDYDKICTMFSGKSRIRILKTVGTPPEKYQVEFLVTSLQKNLSTQKIQTHNSFIVEVNLTGSYPRMAPQCKMRTPVFHPNIAPHAICIGDHWAAGESLPELIARIGEMLAFQSYNLKSPLNGEAARWVEKHTGKLPLDNFDFATLLSTGEAVGRNADGSLKAGTECANCGKHGNQDEMAVCFNHHVTCENCKLACHLCSNVICLKCKLETCAICKEAVCHECICKCTACGRMACKAHTGVCNICGKPRCSDCMLSCEICGKVTCLDDINKMVLNGSKKFACTNCF